MVTADNHAERVAGLSSMAIHECDGDSVAAFAALAHAAACLAVAAGIEPNRAAREVVVTMGKLPPTAVLERRMRRAAGKEN